MSLDPIAKNDVWATMAALARRLRALEGTGGSGGFQTGDILHSVRVHPDMLTTTLSDGDRPGWWLLNGATDPNMATTDPKLFELLGGNVLEDARGRVLATPDGGTFDAGAELGAETDNVSGTTGAGSSHVHGAGSFTVNAPNASASGPNNPAFSGSSGPQLVSGISGTENSHTHPFSGTADVIQPTLVVGTTWIKR